MRFLLIGSTGDATGESLEVVIAELERRGHTVLQPRSLDEARTAAVGAELVLHVDPSAEEDGLAMLRECPGHVFASRATDHRVLRQAIALIVRSRRAAKVLSAGTRRHAMVVPPAFPSSQLAHDHEPEAAAARRPGQRLRLLSFVGPATVGRLVDVAYAVSMLENHAQLVSWRLVGRPGDLRSIAEVCEAIGVGIEVMSESSSVTRMVAEADLVLAPASTSEDPLTDEVVTALAVGGAVVMAGDETDLPDGSYLSVRSTALQEDLVAAFRGVLDGEVDLVRIGRAAAEYAAFAFAPRSRADALIAVAERSLRGVRSDLDAMFPELAAWPVTGGETPGTIYANDFRILQ